MWMSAVMTSSDRYSPVSSRTLDLDGLRDLVFEPFASHAFRGHGIAGRDLVPSAYRRDGPCGYDTLLRMMEGHLKYNGVAVDVPEGLDIEVLEIADLRIFHELCNAQGLPVPDLGSTTDNPYTEASDMIFRDGLRGRWMDRRWLEVACLAQHYGVPTRLLDWTTDVNVALHFAAGSALRHMDGPGDGFCIWVLDLDAAKAVMDDMEVVRPDYSRNPNMRAQSGVMTLLDAAKAVMDDMEVVRPDYSRNPNMRAQSGVMTLLRNRTADELAVPFDRQLAESFERRIAEGDPVAEGIAGSGRPVLQRLDVPYGLLGDLARYLSSHRYDSSRYRPGYEGAYLCMRECMDYSRLPDRR